jgi:plasmid replication initiation protein
MTSIYSIRIYETLIRWKQKKTVTLTVEQLKDRLQLTSKGYNLFGNIKQKVIDPAMDEIRSCSDIDPVYELIKTGNKVTSVKFSYNFKPGMEPVSAEKVKAKSLPLESTTKVTEALINKHARPGESRYQVIERLKNMIEKGKL